MGKVLLKISFVWTSFFILFGYIIGVNTVGLAISLGLTLVAYIFSKDKKARKLTVSNLAWIIIAALIWFSMLYTTDKGNGLKYALCFTFVINIKLIIEHCTDWKRFLVNCLLAFSAIHVLATYLYMINPSFVQGICAMILDSESYYYNISIYKYDLIAGICSENGFNAFCITIFISILYMRVLCNKEHRVMNFIFLIAGFIALLATGKRGLFLANIAAMAILYFIVSKNLKEKIKYIFLICFAVVILFMIVDKVPMLQVVFDRFEEKQGADEILNGRGEMYAKMIENIGKNPVLGSGVRSTIQLIGGDDGHNTYLQILNEFGMVGFLLFGFVFCNGLYNAWKILKQEKKKKGSTEMVYIGFSIYFQLFFLIYGLSGNPLYNFSIFLIYIYAIAMLSDCTNKEEINESRNINIS